jgi:hypothetical protein
MAKCKNCKYLDTVQNDLRSEPFKWCVCTDDSFVLDMERDCDYYTPMTNADRIRSMTDEELAMALLCVLRNLLKSDKVCKDCTLAWLQKESEE